MPNTTSTCSTTSRESSTPLANPQKSIRDPVIRAYPLAGRSITTASARAVIHSKHSRNAPPRLKSVTKRADLASSSGGEGCQRDNAHTVGASVAVADRGYDHQSRQLIAAQILHLAFQSQQRLRRGVDRLAAA